jgi:hypothetical protein
MKYALTLRWLSQNSNINIPIREINKWYIGEVNPYIHFRKYCKEYFTNELQRIKNHKTFDYIIDCLVNSECTIHSELYESYGCKLIYKNGFLFYCPEPYINVNNDFNLTYKETLLMFDINYD